MTVWQLVEQLIWIIEVYITILKTAVLWQIVRELWKKKIIYKNDGGEWGGGNKNKTQKRFLGQLFMRLFAGLL